VKIFLLSTVLGLTLGFTGAVSAQDYGNQSRPFRFFIGLGLTGGGDEVASVQYTNGSTQTLHGGGFVHLNAGVEYRFAQRFSGSLGLGYHVDDSTASNGSVKFGRYPLEVLGHFYVFDRFRVGGGVRFVSGAQITSSGAAGGGTVKLRPTTGAVIEGEYLFSSRTGLKLRYVNETYRYETFNDKVNGSHVGVIGNFYF
jgi:hypothetical protein